MIQRFLARLCCVLHVVLSIAIVLLTLTESLRAQDNSGPDSDAKPLPYRRVFVRDTDLPTLALDGYRPIELNTLERLLALIAQKRDGIDRNLTANEPEIDSFHAQAKLSGADLIAERSRIQWRKGGSDSETSPFGTLRKTLSPWSPAIDSATNKPASPSSLISPIAPTWLFDPSGLPSVRPSGNEDWFSWSSRPQRDSTPNRLNFSFALPRTTNSCLVIQLPKSARIVDSTVVVRTANVWNDVVSRLGSWPVSSGSPESIPELNANDAYWMLELSGQEQASFSILLGPNRTPSNAIDTSDPNNMPFTRLIAKQTTQHKIASDQLRTICEWEWLEGPTQDKTVRLRVPDGFRLRSLTINDRETSLQFAQRIVEASLPSQESTRIAPTATSNRTRMIAEFLVDLDALRSNTPRVTIPPVEFLGSYVVAGTTALVPQATLQLRDISFSSGRLDATRTVPGEGTRLDYSWFQAPPTFTLQVSPKELAHRAELLTKLSTDGPKAIAIVRIQLGTWHPGMPGRIGISPQWQLESSQVNSKSFALKVDDSVESNTQALRLEPVGSPDEVPLQVELQLSRNMQTAPDGALGSEPLIHLPDWERLDALVMEPSYAMRLETVGNYVDEIADEETLTPWQRERLPRLGKYLIFRMLNGQLPALRWKSDTPRVTAHVASDVRSKFNQWRVQHRIELPPSTPQDKPIDILLDGSWRWETPTSEGARRIAMARDPSTSGWRIAPQELQAMQSDVQKTMILTATQSFESSDLSKIVLLPRIPVADALTRTLRIAPELRVKVNEPLAQWEFDSEGERQLRWPSLARDSGPLQIELSKNAHAVNREWFVSRSQLHLAIDAQGSQKGLLLAEVMSLDGTGFELPVVLPEDWSPLRSTLRFEDAESSEHVEIPTMRREGERWFVQWRPTSQEGNAASSTPKPPSSRTMKLELLLQGPALKLNHYTDYGILPSKGFQFQWPTVHVPDATLTPMQFLWVPDHLTLGLSRPDKLWSERVQPADMPELNGWWSMWSWSHEILSFLGFSSVSSSQTQEQIVPPEALIPGWMAPDWILADVHSQPLRPNEASANLILRNPPNASIPALAVALWILVTPWILRRRPWFCLLAAGVSVLAGHWMPNEIAMAFRASMVGIGLGTFLYLAHGVYTSLDTRPKDRTPRHERWSPWNEPSLATDPMSENSGRSKTVLTASVLLVLALGLATHPFDLPPLSQPAQGQEAAARLAVLPDTIFDILVPLNDENAWSGDTVYVPADILKTLDSTSPESTSMDRDAYLISAKHSLRFDSRSIGFGNTEQPCVHTYEVWIGDLAVGRPWRIPFQTDRSRLNRFTIDGAEVAVSRFTKTDTELIWYPERSGRKILQIESQLRIRPLDRDRNPTSAPIGLLPDTKPPRGWAIDAAILPAANATLEVETEGPWTVEIASRGRISNPSIGKYSIQLGGVDRLNGELIAASNPGQRPFSSAPAESTSLGSVEAPQMNTELFIDREQLLARTIIEYARGAEMLGEIEIESDMQWQPVGSVWGDAQLVDVRPGSTLDRRRYIVRWNPEAAPSDASANGATGTPSATNTPVGIKRTVTTTWVPVGEAGVRNILFAECRDRRVRPGTLRYARASGSVWTLDGISAWIPSINTRERIEWSELTERPIATSLKIPLSGGFGVLRKQLDTSVQRARVTHQWLLESSKVNLKSKVELSAPINSRSSPILKLPATYKATKVISRSNSIPFVQWSTESGTSIQLFIDRDNNELNEFLLHAEIPVADTNDITTSLPTMEIVPLPIAQQFADISAEPMWRVEIPNDTLRPVRGLGASKVLASVPLSIDSPPITLQAQRLVEPWAGILVARELTSSDTGTDWELRLEGNIPSNPRPTFALSFPIEVVKQWKSEEAIRELPELEPGRKLLIVQPKWDEELKQYTLRIEMTTDAGIRMDTDWIEQIHPVAQPELECWLESDSAKLDAIDLGLHEIMDVELADRLHVAMPSEGKLLMRRTTDISETRPGRSAERRLQPEPAKGHAAVGTPKTPHSIAPNRSLPLAIHELQSSSSSSETHPDAAGERWLLHSTYWIGEGAESTSSQASLRWTLRPDTHCEWAMVNGESVAFDQQHQSLELDFERVGYPMQIELWITGVPEYTVPENAVPENAMEWDARFVHDHSPVWNGGGDVPAFVVFRSQLRAASVSESSLPMALDFMDVECARVRASLTSLEAMQADTTEIDRPKNPLDPRNRWLHFFALQSSDALRSLASLPSKSSEGCFGESLQQFKLLTADLPEPHQRAIQHRTRGRISWIDATLMQENPTQTLSTQPSLNDPGNELLADWLIRHRDRLIATLCMGLVLVMTAWFWQTAKPWLLRSPWWQLGTMGGLIWLLTGDLTTAVVLLTIGLFLAIETYRILNERFRQSATRAPR